MLDRGGEKGHGWLRNDRGGVDLPRVEKGKDVGNGQE